MEQEIKKPKKKRIFLRKVIITIAVVAIIFLSIGFLFPGLIWVRDLGVRYTETDYQSIMDKLDYVKEVILSGNTNDEYVYGEAKSVEVELTSEEITAFFNENISDDDMIKIAQVKINNDGSVEASGTANIDYILNDVLGGRYSKAQIENMIPALGILPTNVNLYLNFEGTILNNRSNIDINSVEVQGVLLPSDIVKSNEAVGMVNQGLDNMMSRSKTTSGLYFEKVIVENGKIYFKGQIPTLIEKVAE